LFLDETYSSSEIYLVYQARLIHKHLWEGEPECEQASFTMSASLHYALEFLQKFCD